MTRDPDRFWLAFMSFWLWSIVFAIVGLGLWLFLTDTIKG